jgi:hypothetical protein
MKSPESYIKTISKILELSDSNLFIDAKRYRCIGFLFGPSELTHITTLLFFVLFFYHLCFNVIDKRPQISYNLYMGLLSA